MSHRPYIKNDDSGNMSDLAIDAETLQGYKPCVNIVTLEDNNSTTAGTWLAKTNKVSALVDGQLFLYKITVAGASTTTLNITGSGGSLGAKTVYRTGTTKLTTQYAVGHYILLAYNSLNTCFRLVNDYDANSYAYVRQYQHGKNAAGATNLYPILTRYNLTNKNGKYDNAYARFYTDTYIDMTNGYLYAPKVYSGGSEVAVKTDIPTETTVSGWGFTKNVGTVTSVSAGTGLSISGTASTTPTVNIADGYKLQKTISTQDIRITDLQDGTYVLTYSGKIRLYWNGAEGDDYVEHLQKWTNTWNPILVVKTTLSSTYETSWFWQCYNFIAIGWNFKGKVTPSGNAYTSWQDCKYFVRYTYPDTQLGSKTKPVYLEPSIRGGYSNADQAYKESSVHVCDEYAGGTKITLNGKDKGASEALFWAPLDGGGIGQFLKSSGTGGPPHWVDVASVATSGSYNDLINKPTIPTKSSWNYDDVYVKYTAAQELTDNQKAQARTNIGAGTSSFTGYTSSNKLHTDYINNAAGWTSNKGTVTSVRVQAGTGLSSSTSTAETSSLNTTISIADGYKLLTTTEYNTLNAKQDKISALGTTTKPIYFSSNGVVSACLNYGGGTKVTLNGTEHKGSNATMYAPTTAGTSGYSLKSNGSGAPRWANESTVQVSGTISSGAKNNASVTFVITNSSKPLRKGVWRYSGTHGVFLIFATTEITTMGSPRTEYICGYVSSSISNNTSITLVEV